MTGTNRSERRSPSFAGLGRVEIRVTGRVTSAKDIQRRKVAGIANHAIELQCWRKTERRASDHPSVTGRTGHCSMTANMSRVLRHSART